MTSRILPREEWSKLVGTEAESLIAQLPEHARVVVVEDGDQLVGCHILVAVLHGECLWTHPDHRKKGAVARRLWAAVKQEAHDSFDATWLMTGCLSDDVRRLLEHVGAVKMNGDHYMVPLKG